ncbi:MAG TPA: hypothetical protein VK203_06860 [Nostocaceae cyanobacterium]|nr:hypothetical protein [Nostocaceae cyanobacterium]
MLLYSGIKAGKVRIIKICNSNQKWTQMLTGRFIKPLTYPLLASFLLVLVGHSDIAQSPKKQVSARLATSQAVAETYQATLVNFTQTTRPLNEKIAQDLVWKLPQVQRKAREISRLSRGTIRLTAAVDSSPTLEEPYYTVRVLEIHPDKSTDTIYWFRVLSPTGVIEALDLVENQYISLDKWKPDAR